MCVRGEGWGVIRGVVWNNMLRSTSGVHEGRLETAGASGVDAIVVFRRHASESIFYHTYYLYDNYIRL